MRPAIALCLMALALAGCGDVPKDSAKEFKGDQRNVANTVEDLEAAARKNDSDEVCTKLLAKSLLDTLEKQGKNCTTAVADAFRDADAFDLTVDGVTIDASKASAKVTSGTGSNKKNDTLELVKVGAGWRIASLVS